MRWAERKPEARVVRLRFIITCKLGSKQDAYVVEAHLAAGFAILHLNLDAGIGLGCHHHSSLVLPAVSPFGKFQLDHLLAAVGVENRHLHFVWTTRIRHIAGTAAG